MGTHDDLLSEQPAGAMKRADGWVHRGFTVRDVALRYRIGEDKVRSWIKAGELLAINTSAALCGKPRYVITPEALEQFEQRRQAKPMPKVKRRQRSAQIDFYPD